MRLIDADRLCNGICDWKYESFSKEGCETEYAILDGVIDGILRQPTIDAVPVVRCKDCRWFDILQLKKDGTGDLRFKPSLCTLYNQVQSEDYYCADGSKMDDEPTQTQQVQSVGCVGSVGKKGKLIKFTEPIKQFCKEQGIMCELATELGYCKITGCVNRTLYYGAKTDEEEDDAGNR